MKLWRAMLGGICVALVFFGGALVNVVTGQEAAPRDLNTHHCLVPPVSRDAWESRAKLLRIQILASAGLWPMPERTPLKPMITGRTEAEDFVVENVAIETLPGFRLCGNLYRPKGKRGPFPAIANPHGHWSNGRLEMQPDVDRAAPPPAKPAEGRANLTAIGVNLARQGFVVFAYDMVGYNDTSQVSHRFAGSLQHWCHGVSLMGLQLWNSIRAVDYLCSLRDVDRTRIGVTGASGGGTQTFLLTAVDDRIRSAVPVNMVSAYMQGGCLCENGPGLRLGTDNVEIAALAAPRPLLLVSATGDWTQHNPTEEWPAIRKVYALFDSADKTACVQFNYGHNYNIESREAMYNWFARTLGGNAAASVGERPFHLDPASLRVWSQSHPAPAGLLDEKALAEAMRARSRNALRAIWPRSRTALPRFRERMQPAVAAMLGMSQGGSIRPAATPRRFALIVVRSLAEDRGPTDALVEALKPAYTTVQYVEIADTRIDPQKWWENFRSCYNPSPFAVACQQVAEVLRSSAGKFARVDVVGLGLAGPVALFARAVVPAQGAVVADLSVLQAGEEERLRACYAPSMDALGGAATALALVAPSPVIVPGGDGWERRVLADAQLEPTALSVITCRRDAAAIAAALRNARLR